MFTSDPRTESLKHLDEQYSRLNDHFKGFLAQVKELHAAGLLLGASVLDNDELPGFGINFEWARFRFHWEPIKDDTGVAGRLMALRARYDENLQPKWTLVREIIYTVTGDIKRSSPADPELHNITEDVTKSNFLMTLLAETPATGTTGPVS